MVRSDPLPYLGNMLPPPPCNDHGLLGAGAIAHQLHLFSLRRLTVPHAIRMLEAFPMKCLLFMRQFSLSPTV
jgi:hypothetical protein